MATPEKLESSKEDVQALAAQKARIRVHVAKRLGEPAGMLKIRVHPVGSESFRVNVWAGESFTAARITDSFFVTADEQGNVTTCTPQIDRLY